MEKVWKQIRKKNVLLYEGFTMFGKPYGVGTTFFEDGQIYQEGIFDIKGLVCGREYYPSGQLRFEGAYEINRGYGPNFPVYGRCFNRAGKQYFAGQLKITRGGVGYPMVDKPKGYGPVPQETPKPDFFMWEDRDKLAELTDSAQETLRADETT
ncbi:MAG: hypothetical protein IK016_02835 [Lachnospiraceae bacterium]|nr:hypothetical protein [Lachnospiraceae bacterium]